MMMQVFSQIVKIRGPDWINNGVCVRFQRAKQFEFISFAFLFYYFVYIRTLLGLQRFSKKKYRDERASPFDLKT